MLCKLLIRLSLDFYVHMQELKQWLLKISPYKDNRIMDNRIGIYIGMPAEKQGNNIRLF